MKKTIQAYRYQGRHVKQSPAFYSSLVEEFLTFLKKALLRPAEDLWYWVRDYAVPLGLIVAGASTVASLWIIGDRETFEPTPVNTPVVVTLPKITSVEMQAVGR